MNNTTNKTARKAANRSTSKAAGKTGRVSAQHRTGKRRTRTHRERIERRRRIVAIGTLLALLLGVLAQVIGASGALAHAGVVTISPANGSVSTKPPKTVSISFNEGVETSAGRIQLIDNNAKIVAPRLSTNADKSTFTLTPSKPLLRGMYALRWSVTSADGHMVTGASTFAVGRNKTSGKPVNITALGRNGASVTLGTTNGIGSKTFTFPATSAKIVGLELRHKRLGATLELPVVNGKASGILPFAGEWTLTAIERVSTYTEERYTTKITLK